MTNLEPNEKPKKYITDMKELPEETTDLPLKAVLPTSQNVREEKPPEVSETPVEEKQLTKTELDDAKMPMEDPELSKKGRFPLSTRETILVVINVFSIFFLFILLTKLPAKAKEVQSLRVNDIKDEAALSFKFDQIYSHKNDLDLLSRLFLDESGVVRFVNEVEKLKVGDSSIKKVSFTSQKAIKDRTGNFGIPVVIEMSGSWESIGHDLEKLQSLPFLYRTITFEAKPNFEDPGVMDVKYGLLLYLKDEFTKN